jgi:hypothetical protein
LIDRAVVVIREGREQIGIAPSRTEPDKVIDLQTVAASAPDVLVSHALLEAANMIPILKVILNARTRF